MPRFLGMVALVSGAALGCRTEDHSVELVFHEIPIAMEGGASPVLVPSGFTCGSFENGFLAERLESVGPYRASLVMDFLALGGAPGCRSFELERWCAERGCAPVARRCLPLELASPPPRAIVRPRGPPLAINVATAVREAEPWTVVDDAPDDVVVIRAVATIESCDELGNDPTHALDMQRVLGCSYSCPVRLDQATDPVVLAQPAVVTERIPDELVAQFGVAAPNFLLCGAATLLCAAGFVPPELVPN